MTRIRPMGQCEECPPEEGLKEIVSHGLCAMHNQRHLRAIWRKPEPSETQKQKLMEKLEKDLIAIKNMCGKWERDGYVAMKLITPETIETFRTELEDYMDFRPTLKAAEPKTELDEALAGYKAPPPMFADEDAETAAKKAAPGQYQFAPVVEKPAAPAAAAAAPKKAKERKKSLGKEIPKTNGVTKADEPGKGTTPDDTAKENVEQKGEASPPVGFTCNLDGELGRITGVNYGKREFLHSTSEKPVPFADVPNRIRFLVDPAHPDKDVSSYFAAPNPVNETPGKLDENIRHAPLAGKKKPQQANAAEPNQMTTKKGRS